MHPSLADPATPARPVHLVTKADWREAAGRLGPAALAFAEGSGFDGAPSRFALLPDAGGGLAGALLGVEPPGARLADPFAAGRLATLLPDGDWRLDGAVGDAGLATLGLLLGLYRFARYREPPARAIRLVPPPEVDAAEIGRVAQGVAFGRDLVNIPANDLGPAEIEAAARDLAERHGAALRAIVGDDLLAANLPMIHAVGRASPRAPRLIDLAWGHPDHPKATLVGKGVAFDTGGLNIKPDAAMLLMKKDMGGAAVALTVARLVMEAGLRVRLRVLIPAVENAVSGNSFRPGDVLASRKGLRVEIGNTDAEGRLILADALSLADEDAPDLLLDFATLTGAARVALGPDLPALFADDDALAEEVARHARAVHDPVWRLPLWPPYDALLESKVADVNHISGGPFAGAVTAALFLRRFVARARRYAHLDLFAWTPKAQPGRPEGGEVQTARLVYALLRERYPATAR